jgi:hypothetical protein
MVEANTNLLQGISINGETTSSPSSSPPKLPEPVNHTEGDPPSLTPENLTEHCLRLGGHGSSQPDAAKVPDNDKPSHLLAALRDFGVDADIPSSLIEKMKASFEGMTPIERYLAEQDNYLSLMYDEGRSIEGAYTTPEPGKDQSVFTEVGLSAEEGYHEVEVEGFEQVFRWDL